MAGVSTTRAPRYYAGGPEKLSTISLIGWQRRREEDEAARSSHAALCLHNGPESPCFQAGDEWSSALAAFSLMGENSSQ